MLGEGTIADPAQLFIGREPELGRLHAQYRTMVAGGACFALVQGPPGVGKTSLIERFLQELDERTEVIRAGGDESEADVPLAVIDQLLRRSRSPARVSRDEDHVSAGSTLLEAIGEVAADRPVVVAIDDADWADAVSLRAILFAARRLVDETVLLVVAVREPPATALPRGLEALAHGARGVALHLREFTLTELQALSSGLGNRLSPHAAQQVHEHTGGNPLHVTALLQDFAPSEWDGPAESWPAPRTFAALVGGRLADCSAPARALVEAAAVLGMTNALTAVATVAAVSAPLQAIEDAAGAGLLESRVREGARIVTFPHPLIRAAVYQGLGAAARARLHAAVAEVSDSESVRLRHLVAATEGLDPELGARLERFARVSVDAARWTAAAGALVAASRLSDDAADRERRLLDAVEARLYAGDMPGARQLAAELQAFAPGPRRDCVLAYLAIAAGRADEARQLLTNAWTACDAQAEPQLARTIAERTAFLGILRIRASEAIEWGRKATALQGIDLSAWALAFGLDQDGQHEEAAAVLDAAGMTLGDGRPGRIRGRLLLAADELDDARKDLGSTFPGSPGHGSLVTSAITGSNLARAEYAAGEWDDATLHGARAVAVALESDDVAAQLYAHSAALLVPLARGEWAEADEHARALRALTAVFEDHVVVRAIGLARDAAARGDAQAVLGWLEPVLRMPVRDGVDDPGHWPWAHLHADALIDTGRREEAERFLATHRTIARERGRRSMSARLARVDGRLRAARGDGEGAVREFETALELIRPLGMPFEHAQIELVYGRFLRRDGRRRVAAEHLRSAIERLSELEACPSRERAVQELDACGLSPMPRTGDHDRQVLTPQERTVERLVKAGLTNRQIASELMLSVKTVERHLTHVFAKRGVHSRVELRTTDRTPVIGPRRVRVVGCSS